MTEKNQSKSPSVNIISQYLKEIKMENFLFPEEISLQKDERPIINVDLSASAAGISDDGLFEVKITGKINASYSGERKMFNLSFEYAAIFKMSGVPETEKEVLLLVYCPSILFPFVRRIVADITSDSGFPAVMIDMIDFGKLYQESLERKNN